MSFTVPEHTPRRPRLDRWLLLLILMLPGLAACAENGERSQSGELPSVKEAATASAKPGPTPETMPHVEAWARVLERFTVDGGLDYAGLKASPEDLETYLAGVAEARPEEHSRERQIAFWINAYNAVTARRVLDRYPGIDNVEKVRGFFRDDDNRVAGEPMSLDQIEKKGLALGDPRLHFAVVCASTGCPDLRAKPYRAATLEQQLAEQTEHYLADQSKGLRYDAAAGVLYLSKIFDWYSADFGGDAVAWLLPRLPAELAEPIRETDPKVRFLDYDWSLNDRTRPAP